MTNFHEFVHLHESQTARRAQPGVSPRWTNIRWQVLCHRCSEPARHITSLLTKTSDREESGVRRRRSRHFYVTITRSCEYKCKKATVWPRYPESTSCQCWDPLYTLRTNQISVRYPLKGGQTKYEAAPGNA